MNTLLCLPIIFIIVLTQTEGNVLRVVGGYEVPSDFGRFHASLQNLDGNHVCGGTVISKRNVITAAHCVIGAEPEYIKVIVGTTNLDIGGQQYNVSRIKIHHEYNATEKTNDIAILEINVDFDPQYALTLSLSTNDVVEGDRVILSGFGSLEPNGESSRLMLALELTVFSQETCQFAMRYTREVYENMFCTFTQIGQGACHGDSGGPLIKDNQLVGVVSWGIPCAVGFPDVHTRIFPYISWIQEEITK